MGKITIIDVARMAGVSTATVSRSMHSPHVVRPATLERVQAVIRECGYVYNATAGDFSRRKSTVLGVLILSTTTKVASSVSAAQELAAEKGFPLIVSTSGFDPILEKKHIEQFLQRGVAGVLIIGHLAQNRHLIREMQNRGIPCVFLWDVLPGSHDSYVGFDNVQGTYSLVDHCIREGHHRIGFICGFDSGVDRLAKRYEGYKKALSDHAIPLDETLVRSSISSFAKGKSYMQELMALPNPPSCVCCASDVLATGAMAAVHEAGLSVPHDFSIAGFDNIELGPYLNPTLSTVNVPGREMGRLGMEALLTLVEHPKHPPIQKDLPTTLILRQSTCATDKQNPRKR